MPLRDLRPVLDLLVAPAAGLERAGDRRRAQLLAGLLLVLVTLGLLSGVVQLATMPGFLPTFLAMSAALALLAGAYALSRTRGYRLAAAITCLAPVGACLATLVQNPDDRVAPCFMILGVLFATVFLSTRAALLTTGLVLAALAIAAGLSPPFRSPDRFIPVVAFHVIVSSLLLVAGRHRNRLEADQDVRIREAQRFATTGRLAAGLGHDLNNLLMLVINAHNLVSSKDEQVARALGQVRAAGETSARLLRQMLVLARSEEEISQPQETDLNAVVKESAGVVGCALGGSCQLVLEWHPGPLPVRLDPLDVQRIILNLAINARQAMPSGGTLTLRTAVAERLECAARMGLPAGRHAALVVSDSGVGMAPGALSRYFEPFVTSRAGEGSFGLGLAIVADLAHRHGGLIDVCSEPGRGTRFTIVWRMDPCRDR